MKLIVGLGNPGPKYQNTRHNLGFMVLDKLAKKLTPAGKTNWRFEQKSNSLILPVNSELVLAKPQTFMNASGFAVKNLITNYPITNYSSLWLVHDDVDLPLGKLKIRFGGGSAGHHGVESIIQQLGTDEFWRIRVGIGKPIQNSKFPPNRRVQNSKSVEEYVLEEFGENELGELKNMLKKAVEAIKLALKNGPQKAMNMYN